MLVERFRLFVMPLCRRESKERQTPSHQICVSRPTARLKGVNVRFKQRLCEGISEERESEGDECPRAEEDNGRATR